jgi:hypothetical protein
MMGLFVFKNKSETCLLVSKVNGKQYKTGLFAEIENHFDGSDDQSTSNSFSSWTFLG